MPSFKQFITSPFFYALTSALLLSLAETPFDVGIFRWIALIPLLLLIESSVKKSWKLFFIWLSFLLYIMGQYSVVWGTLPFEWLGFESALYAYLALGFFFFTYSFVIAIPALVFYHANKKIYIFPFLFITVEYLRSVLFSTLMLGAPSEIADNLSYGLLAYSVHGSDILLYLAPFFGIYGFSFFIASVNVALYVFFTHVRPSRKTAAALILVSLFFIGIETIALKIPNEKIGTVLPAISIERTEAPRFELVESLPGERVVLYESIVGKALRTHPETRMVVLPENSQFIQTLARMKGESEERIVTDLLGTNTERMLVYGDYNYEEKKSRISYVSNKSPNEIRSLGKEILMPFGEYQPYIAGWLAKHVGGALWLKEVQSYREVRSDKNVERKIEWEDYFIAGASCSEIFVPRIYTHFKKGPPDIIIQVQRLVIFHNDTRVWEHAVAASQLHAAMLRTYIIGSVDGGKGSYIIDPHGRLVGERDGSGYVYEELYFKK